jgi:uncharacterized membrane protein (DUF485 family)
MANPPAAKHLTREERAAALQRYYEELSAARKRVVVPLASITLVAFFLQQILTNFTPVMDGLVFEGMTWAFLYSFALFILVLVLTMIYKAAMDKVERGHRPPHLDQTAAHYDDWRAWERHQATLEADEELRDEHQREALIEELRHQHEKEKGL